MSSESSSSSSASDSEDDASRPRGEFPPGSVTVIFTLLDGAEARRTKVDLPDGTFVALCGGHPDRVKGSDW